MGKVKIYDTGPHDADEFFEELAEAEDEDRFYDECLDVDFIDSDLRETDYEDVVLFYVDDSPEFPEATYESCEKAATDILGQYSFDEILQMNEIEETELLALLYHRGDLGLPAVLEDESEALESGEAPEEIED